MALQIGDTAPDFEAETTEGPIRFHDWIGDSVPDKLPMPLQVHRRQGSPCPRCGTSLEAVHFKDYVMTYCPADQAEGRVYKDRRLSRLLK